MARYTIYTDGSCLGNPGPGGWAAIVKDNFDGKTWELSGGEKNTTNNRMEITSVLEALRSCKEDESALIYSDSQYVCNAFEKGWLSKWFRNGWKSSSGKPVLNKDLWVSLAEECGKIGVKFQWVRGHNGNTMNERCDQLAVAEAQKFVEKKKDVTVQEDMPVEILPFERKRMEFSLDKS